jgi:hypothetical protein
MGAPALLYPPAMSDRVFFSLAALMAVLLIALAAVWPQGLGARSPGPFGHPVARTPEATRAAITRETAAKIAANPRAAAQVLGLRTGKK